MIRLFRLEIWIWNNISEDYEIISEDYENISEGYENISEGYEKSPKISKLSLKVIGISPKVSILQHALKGQKLLAQGNTLGIR